MSLYELVLDFEGQSAEEVRLTSEPVRVGDTVEVDAVDWVVVRELARRQRELARFQCRRAKSLSQRAREMQASMEDLRLRVDDQRARIAHRSALSDD